MRKPASRTIVNNRPTLLTALLLALLLSLILTTTTSAATTYRGPTNSKAAVIVIHGGAYLVGSNAMTQDSADRFAAAGIRAINLQYPLGDLDGAANAVADAAASAKRKHRYVYVYGESAGGGLAALAAARGLVDGGYAWAPVSNLTSWKPYTESTGLVDWRHFTDATPATLARNSALDQASKKSSPLLVTHGRDDDIVPYTQSEELSKRWPRLTLLSTRGGHQAYEKSYRNATKTALNCFIKKKHCRWAKAR